MMPETRMLPTSGETPSSKDPVVTRADVIASNDSTSHDERAPEPPLSLTAAQPGDPSVGALLRESREKLSLSPGDIAAKLRMGVKQVVALENSDYAALPTGTFLRGFVRNYAKAVALNASDVLTLLERTHSGAAAVKASSVVVPSQQNIKVPAPGGELVPPSGRAFAIAMVILLLLAAAWYWWEYVYPHRFEGGRANGGATQSIAVPPPAFSSPGSAPAVGSEPAGAATGGINAAMHNSLSEAPAVMTIPSGAWPDAGTQPAAAIPVKLPPVLASAKGVESTPDKAPAPTAGRAALGFTFSGDSWVEVVDGSGKTIVSRRFGLGDAEEVIGRAPYSIVIGNAKATRMAFNGREFDLNPYTHGAVARVTLK
jgi:cytoskeleton protein RodZ